MENEGELLKPSKREGERHPPPSTSPAPVVPCYHASMNPFLDEIHARLETLRANGLYR